VKRGPSLQVERRDEAIEREDKERRRGDEVKRDSSLQGGRRNEAIEREDRERGRGDEVKRGSGLQGKNRGEEKVTRTRTKPSFPACICRWSDGSDFEMGVILKWV